MPRKKVQASVKSKPSEPKTDELAETIDCKNPFFLSPIPNQGTSKSKKSLDLNTTSFNLDTSDFPVNKSKILQSNIGLKTKPFESTYHDRLLSRRAPISTSIQTPSFYDSAKIFILNYRYISLLVFIFIIFISIKLVCAACDYPLNTFDPRNESEFPPTSSSKNLNFTPKKSSKSEFTDPESLSLQTLKENFLQLLKDPIFSEQVSKAIGTHISKNDPEISVKSPKENTFYSREFLSLKNRLQELSSKTQSLERLVKDFSNLVKINDSEGSQKSLDLSIIAETKETVEDLKSNLIGLYSKVSEIENSQKALREHQQNLIEHLSNFEKETEINQRQINNKITNFGNKITNLRRTSKVLKFAENISEKDKEELYKSGKYLAPVKGIFVAKSGFALLDSKTYNSFSKFEIFKSLKRTLARLRNIVFPAAKEQHKIRKIKDFLKGSDSIFFTGQRAEIAFNVRGLKFNSLKFGFYKKKFVQNVDEIKVFLRKAGEERVWNCAKRNRKEDGKNSCRLNVDLEKKMIRVCIEDILKGDVVRIVVVGKQKGLEVSIAEVGIKN